MAFSKIAGLEVIPRRESSWTRRASSPPSTSLRSIWSSQMLVPSAVSRARRSFTDAALLMCCLLDVSLDPTTGYQRQPGFSRVEHFLTRQQGCSAHSGTGSVSREADLRAGTHAGQDEAPCHGARGFQEELSGRADPAPDH